MMVDIYIEDTGGPHGAGKRIYTSIFVYLYTVLMFDGVGLLNTMIHGRSTEMAGSLLESELLEIYQIS